jgi:hypothetical protein
VAVIDVPDWRKSGGAAALGVGLGFRPSFRADLFRHRPQVDKTNPLGVKGAGESGTIGALASVMNAVNDALGRIGAGYLQMPATPEKVWLALQGAGVAAGGVEGRDGGRRQRPVDPVAQGPKDSGSARRACRLLLADCDMSPLPVSPLPTCPPWRRILTPPRHGRIKVLIHLLGLRWARKPVTG